MRESSSITCNNRRLRNRVEVTRRYRPVTEIDMALRADKLSILVFLIDFVVENSAVIQGRGDVAALRAATRFHRHFLCLIVRSFHHRYVVTLRALQIGMNFMSKRAS